MFKRGNRWVTMEEIKRTQNKDVEETPVEEVVGDVIGDVIEEVIIEEKPPFCIECTSKGKFHKAGCPLKEDKPGLL